MLIVYGATAGVSVVQLYAGAFFPGLMLAALYVGYVIVLAKLKPQLAPPLSEEEQTVPAAGLRAKSITGARPATRCWRPDSAALGGARNADVPRAHAAQPAGRRDRCRR
ncbi:MAG: TRAP transporter large permease subunit [Comamonadaceae bacterium]|nr:TRAP transporter large permease subunit [Comamonadaceae bacterium]